MKKYTLGKDDYFDTKNGVYVVCFPCNRKIIPTDLTIVPSQYLVPAEHCDNHKRNTYLTQVKLVTQKGTGRQVYRCIYKIY